MLRELRKKAGLTQQELAEAIGITEQAIGHYEMGRRQLSVPIAKKIAKALGCKWWELYEGDETEERDEVIEPVIFYDEFGKYLKKLRGKQSLRKFAEPLGISHTQLDRMEKGFDPRTGVKAGLSIEMIAKAAQGLNVDPIELCRILLGKK